MKIVREYNPDYKVVPLVISKASYVGNFKIAIRFSNDLQQTVDFKPFLQNSLHPAINKYLDEEKFKNYKIVDGNINWNNYELIFPIEDLMKGKI